MEYNYSVQENKILSICRNEYKYFLSKANVVGVGLGYKVKGGFNTFTKCIKILVTKKISEEQLYLGDILPKLYKENETDIVECGIMKPYTLHQRVRPVIGGYSVSPSMGNRDGTVGCLVKDGENIYFLGNNHIFSLEQTISLGVPIVQPSILDGGVIARDTIGNLYKYIPLKYTTKTQIPINYCDCAIAKVLSQSITSPNIAFIGRLSGTNIPYLNQSVQKVGRTTEHTVGNVIMIGAALTIKYNRGDVTFLNQIITSKMAEPGDSGSILCNLNKEVLGILATGSNNTNMFNPIHSVLNSLNVTIVR